MDSDINSSAEIKAEKREYNRTMCCLNRLRLYLIFIALVCVTSPYGLAWAQGDANQDGMVTAADITCVILGIFAMPCPMPDCNGDGTATAADITCVIIDILSEAPPEPPPSTDPPSTDPPLPEICDDVFNDDEDGDGKPNCTDTDCEDDPVCIEFNCANFLDDDEDGLIDCDDVADCEGQVCLITLSFSGPSFGVCSSGICTGLCLACPPILNRTIE